MSKPDSDKLKIPDDKEIDVVLTHYEQLREESRILNQASFQRILQGAAAIAVGFSSLLLGKESTILFIFLPFIFFYLFMQDMIGVIKRVQLEFQIARIQRAINIDEFDWEQRRKHQITDYDMLVAVPNIAAGVSLFLAYTFFAWMGIYSIRKNNISDYIGIGLDPLPFTAVYMVLGLVSIAALLAHSRMVTIEKARLKDNEKMRTFSLDDAVLMLVNWVANEDKDTKE